MVHLRPCRPSKIVKLLDEPAAKQDDERVPSSRKHLVRLG